MGLTLITAATAYPVTLAEAKAHCRVDDSADDTTVQILLQAATDHIERYAGRAIMTQTWELTLDAFSDTIMLPKGPVQSITSVKYFDTAGAEQTVSAANYTLDAASDPQWLVKAADYSWPATLDGVNMVKVRFVAGEETAPDVVRLAALLLIGQWYDNRAAASERALTAMPNAVDALLANYRSYSF